MDFNRSYFPVPRGCITVPPINHTETSVEAGSLSKPGASAGQTHPKQVMAINRMLSVTDLLQRVEHQTKVCAELFPLIDKEKYMKKARVNIYSRMSRESLGSIPNCADINSLRMQCGGDNDESSDEIQTLDQSVDETEVTFVEREPLNAAKKEETDAEILWERSRKMSKHDCIVKTPLPPSPDSTNDREINVAPHIWIGVTIEYVVPSSRLKINVNTLNDYAKKKGTRLTAKVCLMPGIIQQHKVDVFNALESPTPKSCVDFRGMKASDLINMDIAIRLYAKTGFFRKSKMIHEWSVAMEDIDLSDAQTAWKKIQWNM